MVPAVPAVRTERLRLRGWRPEDRASFAAMNTDPAVVEFLPAALTRAESDAFVDRIEAGWATYGYGLWAVDVPGVAPFVGYVGLSTAVFEARFTPAVEVGWRLARDAWGFGYATEAGRASLRYGFETVGLDEIVSFTAVQNLRSRAVMERLGLRRDPADDFEHPNVAAGSDLRRHVLYRLDRPTWAAAGG
ncbi:MAG TPA: GNAT family N-acetyltransferase [Acidimicrobiia bacterium]|nr:GNAT family N-acetyltransferase [Acidimicrobiia bacterium]